MESVSLTYRRPSYVESIRRKDSSLSSEYEKDSLRSGVSGVSKGIPDALSFEKILRGETCAVGYQS